MPKPITLDMLHEMTPDQRKTLHRNASSLDTDAAREVLDLLAQDGLMAAPKAPAKKAPAKKAGTAKKAAAKPKKAAVVKPKTAVYGRQA